MVSAMISGRRGGVALDARWLGGAEFFGFGAEHFVARGLEGVVEEGFFIHR